MSREFFQELPQDLEYDENITLLRYMNVSLLYHLLKGETYPLTCLKSFDDKKELPLLKELIKNINGNNSIGSDFVYDVYRHLTVGSSWSQNSHEMIDMWERYTNRITGVVIKTNAKRLYDSILVRDILCADGTTLPVRIKKIKYVKPSHIDYVKSLSKDVVERIVPFSHYYKTVAFRNENEVRNGMSILTNKKLKEFMTCYTYKDRANIDQKIKEDIALGGVNLPVANGLLNLIEEVRISPFSYPRFKEDVEDMIKVINVYREKQNKQTFDHINVGLSDLL